MRDIAEWENISIFVPENAWYSFFNSPYIGHKLGTAIDIYFPDDGLFPVERGVVEKIRNVKPPKRYIKHDDFVIVIHISSGICLKVLHVKPKVRIGEKLMLGDSIGEMISSGFFLPWSSKHAHIEIRRCNDSIRARGAFPLKPIYYSSVPATKGNEFRIVETHENFCWAEPVEKEDYALTPLTYQWYPIEGGIPHYGYGAVFSSVKVVNIFGRRVKVDKFLGYAGLFPTDFHILANGKMIKGIGIYCNQPKIKIIGGCGDIEDEVHVKIELSSPEKGENQAGRTSEPLHKFR